MGRTIIVGDIHGCADELRDLLTKVAFVADEDQLICVGDLVVRGPKPAKVVSLVRRFKGRTVKGNHEHRLLRFRQLWKERRKGGKKEAAADHKLSTNKWLRGAAKALSAADWAYLAAMPLWLDLKAHNVRVVHAGLVPGIAIEKQQSHTLMFVRCIDELGRPSAMRDAGRLWGELYQGPPHVVFGHNAMSRPQCHRWATGLDTGCVYGGRLTAMVLNAGQAPPPVAKRAGCLVSVAAREIYVPIG